MSSPMSHKPGHEWHTPMVARIKSMHEDSGLGVRAIALKLEVPKSSVSDLLASKDVRRQPKNRGRPSILNEDDIERMMAAATKDWQGRQLSWIALGESCDLYCSEETIRRAMHAAGYKKCKACKHPFISEPSRIKRLHWDSLYGGLQTPQWSDWRFSDEVTFTSGTSATAWVIRTTKERHDSACTQNTYWSGRASFACWGMIGENYKSKLVFIEGHGKSGGMNTEDYATQVLEAEVGPYFQKIYECKGTTQDRPYAARPSRTQQLANPKLLPKLASEAPSNLLRKKGIADEQLAKKNVDRGSKRSFADDVVLNSAGKRQRSPSSYSSTSVSTISTNLSRSPSAGHGLDPLRQEVHKAPRSYSERKRKYGAKSSSSSYTSDSSYMGRRKSYHNDEERNTRRRRSSISPDVRGREMSHDSRRGFKRSRSRSHSMDRSRIARNRQSMTPGIAAERTVASRFRQKEHGRAVLRERARRYSNDNDRYGGSHRDTGSNAIYARAVETPAPPPRERSLSPFSKRRALTQAINAGR